MKQSCGPEIDVKNHGPKELNLWRPLMPCETIKFKVLSDMTIDKYEPFKGGLTMWNGQTN